MQDKLEKRLYRLEKIAEVIKEFQEICGSDNTEYQEIEFPSCLNSEERKHGKVSCDNHSLRNL